MPIELWHLHAFVPGVFVAEFRPFDLPMLTFVDRDSGSRITITGEPGSADRLRLAAAALNGDWAELRQLLDAVAPDREAVDKKEPTP